MLIRRLLRTLLVLSLIAPPATGVPPALAQTRAQTDTPPADPPYPDGAIIESIPPDAIVLSLDETIKLALENNLSIIVQRYQPRTTATLIDVQQAAFDPSVVGTADWSGRDEDGELFDRLSSSSSDLETTADDSRYSATWFDPLTIGGSYSVEVGMGDNDLEEGSFDQYLGNSRTTSEGSDTYWRLTYNQSLLRNLGRDVNLWPVVVAQKTLGISESVFRQTVIDTVAAAERAYWDLNFTIMQLRSERFSLKLAQDFLEQNRIKVRVGTLAPIEITQAEAGVADREETVIIFEAALRAAEDQVRRVIGVRSDSKDWDRPVRPSDPMPPEKEEEIDEDAAMQAALANRPDLEQAHLAIEARDIENRARKSLRRWGLDFRGTYGNADADSDFLFEAQAVPVTSTEVDGYQTTTWTAGLLLSIPIHNRLAIANATRTENELAQAQYQLAQAEQLARVEISAAVRSVRTNIRRVQSSEVNLRLQREKLSAEQKKFENGMSTSFQVLQFQDDLANAETRNNLAKADYTKSLVELERVKGTILAQRGILLTPATADQEGGRDQSAALRGLWARPAGLSSDPGLLLARRVSEGVSLPTDFSFNGSSWGARPATTDWVGGGR